MVPFDLRDDEIARLCEAAAGEACAEHTTVWCRADGTPLEVAVSLAHLGGTGDDAGIAVIARDISERRLEQAQLEAYARDVRASFGRELRRARELERSYFHTVRALAAAVEAKDGYTGAHIQRVHAIGLLLARTVAPDQADDPQLAYGFLLHDIGKLSVPDAVLKKPGPLDRRRVDAHAPPPRGGRADPRRDPVPRPRALTSSCTTTSAGTAAATRTAWARTRSRSGPGSSRSPTRSTRSRATAPTGRAARSTRRSTRSSPARAPSSTPTARRRWPTSTRGAVRELVVTAA